MRQDKSKSHRRQFSTAVRNQLKFPARRRCHGNAQQEICRVSATKDPRAPPHFLFHLANLHQSGPGAIRTRTHLSRKAAEYWSKTACGKYRSENPECNLKYSAAAAARAAREFVAFSFIPPHGCYDLLYLLTLRHCLFEGHKALLNKTTACIPACHRSDRHFSPVACISQPAPGKEIVPIFTRICVF